MFTLICTSLLYSYLVGSSRNRYVLFLLQNAILCMRCLRAPSKPTRKEMTIGALYVTSGILMFNALEANLIDYSSMSVARSIGIVIPFLYRPTREWKKWLSVAVMCTAQVTLLASHWPEFNAGFIYALGSATCASVMGIMQEQQGWKFDSLGIYGTAFLLTLPLYGELQHVDGYLVVVLLAFVAQQWSLERFCEHGDSKSLSLILGCKKILVAGFYSLDNRFFISAALAITSILIYHGEGRKEKEN